MTDVGGVTSIGSPGDGAEVCRVGVRMIGTVRDEAVWAGSNSLVNGLRCARSCVEAIVGLPMLGRQRFRRKSRS